MKFSLPLFGMLCIYLLAPFSVKGQDKKSLAYPDEKHFKNLRQLTTGGDNAEAYYGFDNDILLSSAPTPQKASTVTRYFMAP